jgi:hypothetical protein
VLLVSSMAEPAVAAAAAAGVGVGSSTFIIAAAIASVC